MIRVHQPAYQQNQQATIQGQIESSKAAEEGKQETERVKGDIDIEKVRIQEESSSKTAILTLVSSLLSKGVAIPAYLQPLVNSVVENIMIPLVAQNDQQKTALIQQMQQAQQEGQQPQMVQPPEMAEQKNIQPPQQQVA